MKNRKKIKKIELKIEAKAEKASTTIKNSFKF